MANIIELVFHLVVISYIIYVNIYSNIRINKIKRDNDLKVQCLRKGIEDRLFHSKSIYEDYLKSKESPTAKNMRKTKEALLELKQKVQMNTDRLEEINPTLN